MNKHIYLYLILSFSLLILANKSIAQCNTSYPKNQSNKIANYDIKVNLDHNAKKAICAQVINWHNTSPDTLHEIRLYMYMNAFKNEKSTFLNDSNRDVFGQNLKNRPAEQWGHIKLLKAIDSLGIDISKNQKYIQPNDDNIHDESILSIPLTTPLLPNEKLTLDIEFEVKLPKTIVRSGYGKNDFFLFVHWFPQMCVYEQDVTGRWGWNSHQFFRGTEFYADFGDYRVEIDASDHLIIGGSGCKISESKSDGRQQIIFVAHDLIDFGWVAYPEYDVTTSQYRGVDIEILMVPEHCDFADRYLEAIQHSIEYLEKHVGPYPYPKITVVDPPVHTLNSGFMEYPMMITCATVYGIPKNIRSVESLVIHEFTHMYFMATLASNEKESAWLDEGFVTYYEDRILDHYHGEQSSFYDILGVRSGNAQQSRNEYVSLPNPRIGTIARPGWEFTTAFKPLIYAKTATAIKTMERIIGRDAMDDIMQYYFQENKFSHPREDDLLTAMKTIIQKRKIDFDVDQYWNQVLHDTVAIDYQVKEIIANSKGDQVYISRGGTFDLPVEVLLTYQDGTSDKIVWQGNTDETIITGAKDKKIIKAHIDPEHKIYLDLNFNNNSFTFQPNKKPLVKYAAKIGHWFQTVSQWTSFLL